MEKTAMQRLIDWVEERDMYLSKEWLTQLLAIEKEQLCKMYVQGRNDGHLDYYPEKHAKETYDEFFNNNFQN